MEVLIVSCVALIVALFVAFSAIRSYRENKALEDQGSSLSCLGLKPYKSASTDAVKKLIVFIPADTLKGAILEHIEKHGLFDTEHSFLSDLSDTDCVKNWAKSGKVNNA